ncbi:hypothetical protein L484_021626 [Morus notabilis]|uniref:Uncharacterized protein n=1 Tax=Morus notabilis TaxID=981085 RepID=W9S5Z1_9ROSA|nr:hypothetical protein L484_021626 [Morus notabilis]
MAAAQDKSRIPNKLETAQNSYGYSKASALEKQRKNQKGWLSSAYKYNSPQSPTVRSYASISDGGGIKIRSYGWGKSGNLNRVNPRAQSHPIQGHHDSGPELGFHTRDRRKEAPVQSPNLARGHLKESLNLGGRCCTEKYALTRQTTIALHVAL